MTENQKKLIEENVKLAWYVAGKFMTPLLDFEERLSAAYYGLVKAAVAYDATKKQIFQPSRIP